MDSITHHSSHTHADTRMHTPADRRTRQQRPPRMSTAYTISMKDRSPRHAACRPPHTQLMGYYTQAHTTEALIHRYAYNTPAGRVTGQLNLLTTTLVIGYWCLY